MSSDVLLATVVTPSYRPLLNEFFIATLPAGFSVEENVVVCEVDPEYDNAHANVGLLKKFEKERLQKICDLLHENEGKIIFFVDADVCFAGNVDIAEDIARLLEDKDILFQRNGGWPYNFGLFAFRCNSEVKEFFEDVLENHFESILNTKFLHDQHVINELLNPDLKKRVKTKPVSLASPRNYEHLRHGCLPPRYHGRGEELSEEPFLIHSIGVKGVKGKRKILANFKRQHYDNKQ